MSNKLPIYWNSKLNSAQQVLKEQCIGTLTTYILDDFFFHTWFFHIPAHDRRPFVHMITTFCVVVRTDFCVLNLELMYYSTNTTMVLSKSRSGIACMSDCPLSNAHHRKTTSVSSPQLQNYY